MMEDVEKVVLVKKDVEIETFEYNGANVKLNPFISAQLELSLIKLYLEKYFTPNYDETLSYLKEGHHDSWLAEYSVKRTILEELTNVDIYETNTDTIVDVFMIVSESIKNYDDFKNRLYKQVQAIKDSKSVGIVIDNLATKGIELIQSFQNIDPEALKKVADEIIGKMESSSVAPIFDEAVKLNTSEINTTPTVTKRKAKESK